MSQTRRENRRRNRQKLSEGEDMKGRNNQRNTKEVKTFEYRDTTPLSPLNARQREYIDSIYNHPVIICTGVWGSSKTYIPSVIASDLLMSKQIEKIIIARPAEGKAKSVGFFKGDKNEKLSGWAAPILDTFKKRMGLGQVKAFLENEKIELLALEQVKGRSWDNAFIIVDEAEDLEPEVAKSLVGRQGINSTIVITGDVNQKDLKSYSGLELLLEVSQYGNIDMAVVDFDDWEYCVRSEEAKEWGKAFERYDTDGGKV
ncbi:phosphate starvation-inducible protein [Trabzonvirus APT65]|uniref:PhoH-like protein n=1 Tax=Aeromonas phage APT65 TaxID=2982914 RepID=A0A9E8GA89_9CAUD|nr:phosphate starvation-inducible protein [Aeromonas phage APT65]